MAAVSELGMVYRILVTGASGFVGSALIQTLAAAGHQVRAAVRKPDLLPSLAGVQSVKLPDLAGPVDWSPLVEGIDVVVHLAGIAHRSGVDETLYDRAIREATAGLANACRARGVNRLIFVSSIGAQTGSSADRVVDETGAPQPATAYDRAKLAAEQAVRLSGTSFVILRPVIVYGPGAKANIASLLRIADSPLPLPFGAFHNRRSYVALQNLVQAIMLCLDSSATLNETFIVADPAPLSLAEVFTVLRQAQGRPAWLVSVPQWTIKLPLTLMGRGQIWERIGGELVVSSQKLQDAGWRPEVDTRAGLLAMVRAGRR